MTVLRHSVAVLCCFFLSATTLAVAKDAALNDNQKLGFALIFGRVETYQSCLRAQKDACGDSCIRADTTAGFCIPKFFDTDFRSLMDVSNEQTSTLKKCGLLDGSDSASCKADVGCGPCGKACVPLKSRDGEDFRLGDFCVSFTVADQINTVLSAKDSKGLFATCAALTQCSANSQCHEAIKNKVCVPKTLEDKSLTTEFISFFSLKDEKKLSAYYNCLKASTAGSECVDCGGIKLPSEAQGKLLICGSTPAPTTTTTSSSNKVRAIAAYGLAAPFLVALCFL